MWISVSFNFVTQNWKLVCLHPDLIPARYGTSAEVVSRLLEQITEDWVPKHTLVATITADGGNEKYGAEEFLSKGDTLHCAAHNIQLCLDDILSTKKANTKTKLHREILRKCHSLVVLVNGHHKTARAFETLAKAKLEGEEGQRKFNRLTLDCETRWDSELDVIEKVTYFDTELRKMFQMSELQVPITCVLTSTEFDVANGMVNCLQIIRNFTKIVQYRTKPTLCFVPDMIDKLVTNLQPGKIVAKWIGLSTDVIQNIEIFQQALVESITSRFEPMFSTTSLALAARSFCPGATAEFKNFQQVDKVKINELIIENTNQLKTVTELESKLISSSLLVAQERLAAAEPIDPLQWWSMQNDLTILHPVVRMFLAIPASSGQSESAFSSSGFLLGDTRTSLSIPHFRSEFRIKQYFDTAGELSDVTIYEQRKQKRKLMDSLIDRYTKLINTQKQEENNKQDFGTDN